MGRRPSPPRSACGRRRRRRRQRVRREEGPDQIVRRAPLAITVNGPGPGVPKAFDTIQDDVGAAAAGMGELNHGGGDAALATWPAVVVAAPAVERSLDARSPV